jgi:glycosyltransferase involved in cell wall biosynthesis
MRDVALSIQALPEQTRPWRLIAVMPAYNEEATITSVLERLEPLVDEIVVVDDGSTDCTREVIFTWSRSRPNVHTIFLKRNRGMSAAYYIAFESLRKRVESGDLSPDDIILTIDADGQHEPAEVEALVARLREGELDAVIARRDLSTYTLYKRLGNWLMSLWASLWAGRRLYDVESGFRVFRLGALLNALRYYRGYKYSETVEVAVILPRLGYRVSNDLLVPVPVFRSRTRIKDLLIDVAAIPAAWWRVVTSRSRPRDVPSWATYLIPALVPLALLFITVDLLINPIFLGDDSVHNYAHVWYISQQLFDHARLPLRMALLDSGRAVTFPYALVPYLLSAVLFRPLGDWAVTLMMAVAVLGSVWTAGLVRPVLRSPWFLLLFIMNPFFIDAVYSFQFATLWSAIFFFLFIWGFERRRYLLAAPLLWLTVSSHPIVGAFAVGLYGLWLLALDRARVRPLVLLSIPVGLALIPIFWMMLLTSSVRENSLPTVVLSVLDVLPRRGTVMMAPFIFVLIAPLVRRFYLPTFAVFAGFLAVGLLMTTGPLRVSHGSYYGAVHFSTDIYADFFKSPQFVPGATYRVLEPNEREDGMYHFIRHGAVLSNEFYSESVFRRSWTEAQYGCYLAFKGVDYVVVEKAYLRQWPVNEQDLLESLGGAGQAEVSYTDPEGKFTVYDVQRFASEQAKPAALSECGLY